MTIEIDGYELGRIVVNLEYKIGVIERIVERMLSTHPGGDEIWAEIQNIRDTQLKRLQAKYPSMGVHFDGQ